ncbi:hypothetical protein SBA4_2770011 [Candidatus Sulfopaludibacter sp. SbA4]|nr:hypothetical protein SBA4_2770011 [Candidatus Sulfopaludibacter sp. SbA4]
MAAPTVAYPPSSPTGQVRRRRASYAWWFAVACLLFAAVYLAAFALQRYGAGRPGLAALGPALVNVSWRNIG